MLHFKNGSQLHTIISLLSVCGEFPLQSIRLLGNEKVFRSLIYKLTKQQTIRCDDKETNCRLLTLTGKAHNKSLRLYKSAITILEGMGAAEYYLQTFWNHRFPGDSVHRERNFRVAETIAMCMLAGYEYRPYKLPKLCNTDITLTVKGNPVYYPSKELKKVGETDMNKTMFSRVTGVVFAHGVAYAVYNTRNALMKWNGMSEFKVLHDLIAIGRMNAGIQDINSAILFGQSEEIALATIAETEKNRRLEFRFDSVYRHIHFIPMNEYGIRQLKIITVPDWKERILEVLFDPEERSYDRGNFEYDAIVGGVYVYSFLDGDIARLMRVNGVVRNNPVKFEVICYPHQTKLLQSYLGEDTKLKILAMDAIEEALGLKEDVSEEE